MTGVELPRADAPGGPSAGRGFFAFGRTDWRGIDWPFVLLCGYFFIGIAAIDEEWAVVARFRPRLLLGSLALLAATLQIARGAFSAQRGPAPPDAPSAWWGGYLLATLLATLWAYDPALAKQTLLDERLTALLCFPLIATLVRTRRRLLLLVLVFCAAYGFYLLRSYMEFIAGRYVATMGVKRMVGAGGSNADPNSFGATIVFSLPLLIWAGIHTRSWLLRVSILAYGVLGALAVVLTRSRAGLVLLGLTALYTLFALPRGRTRAVGVGVLVFAGLVASTQLSDDAIRRYAGMLTGGSTASERASTEGRIVGYRLAWQIFEDHPVVGIGPGNWATYRMRKIDGDTLLPHNMPGQLIATLGLCGTLTFGGFLLSTFLRAVRERHRRRQAVDPWERAMRAFMGAAAFTLVLLLISGLAAHNLGRWTWYWAPALVVVACAARPEPVKEKGMEKPS